MITEELAMQRALELATRGRGRTSPNPMVGAVILKQGRVIGEGWHRQVGGPHAEIEAFAAASESVDGATLVVNLEPCSHYGRTPPCAKAVIESGIRRVVVAMADPNPQVAGRGLEMLRQAGVDVQMGLMEVEARDLNRGFVQLHTQGRPWVTCKWAMTLDGRIGLANGESRWITSPTARTHAHELRTYHDAVAVGIGTLLADDPLLNVRLEREAVVQPRRVVVDSGLRIPLTAKLLHSTDGEVIVVTTERAAHDKVQALRDAGHQVMVVADRAGRVCLNSMLEALASHGVCSVLCEGGAHLHGALFAEGLVDGIAAYIAPKVVGGDRALPPTMGWGVEHMAQALKLENSTSEVLGVDLVVQGRVARG